LAVVTLAPAVERRLVDALQRSDDGIFLALDPATAQELILRLGRACEDFAAHDRSPALLCSSGLRPRLRRLVERFLPSLAILSPAEIPAQVRIQSRGAIDLGDEGAA